MPVSSPPIANGSVAIEQSRIVAVGPSINKAEALDVGDVVLLPGLINAHTHLELTGCRGQFQSSSFIDWVQQVSAYQPNEPDLRESIRDGLQASLAAGVTTVADIGCGYVAVQEWLTSHVNVIGFLEVLGMGPKRTGAHERSFEKAAEICTRLTETPFVTRAHQPFVEVGIAPHAPYSTDRTVYRQAITLVKQTRRPICTHLAETPEEELFLRDGSGPFRELLERLNLWDDSFKPPGYSPVRYAQSLGLLACDPLLVHMNYVSDEDLDILAKYRCSVSYCPRTHHFFGHPPHRYADMLARGINVCIGTDSLASNPSLSVLDELRFLRRQGCALRNDELLTLATLAGARALGQERAIGSLQPEKRADLMAIPLAHPAANDPLEDLLSSDLSPIAVYIGGRSVLATS